MRPGDPVLPDYGGACISNLVPALLERDRPAPWLPSGVRPAEQVVLLVLDGLGWNQLNDRRRLAPTLASMQGGHITSVVPTTTSTALSSIVLGSTPAEHGVVGYRIFVGHGKVLNVLRWRTSDGDARQSVPASVFHSIAPFCGSKAPVITRAEFGDTGFSSCLGFDDINGWRTPSSIAVEVDAALAAGEPFVYAYYDGIDKVAHERGFGDHYDAELVAADRIVGDIVETLPRGAVLVVTSDHGQVQVGDNVLGLHQDVLDASAVVSGEGRFMWLHAAPGRAVELAARCRELYAHPGIAQVVTRDEMVAAGWFGGELSDATATRLGDVALVATEPVAFLDPADPGSTNLVCRHGSVTADEMLVPLLAVGSRQ